MTAGGGREGLVVRGLRAGGRGPYDLRVSAGECVVVQGPSGVGKSLLLRMIADLDESEGEVTCGGLRRAAVPAPAWRRQVTYVAAEPGWWAETVAEHLSDADAARSLLPSVGLPEAVLAASPAQLSTGERQRLSLVRALVQRPAALLLDEPTAALDPDTTRRVEALLGRVRAGGTALLVVTHDEGQAARIADRRLRLTAEGLREVGGADRREPPDGEGR